jgi:gliding motility-associated lipoprotein GldD
MAVQKNIVTALVGIMVVLGIVSCNSDYTLKQRGYYKIDFPEREYTVYNQPGTPYTFEYPVYGKVVKDTSFFDARPENDYWINIDFPQFYGKIYISYKEVRKNNFDSLVADAFKMTYKHTTKATEIRDSLMKTPKGLTGIFFQVGGNAATAKQFFVTDSVKHFLRGALYFDASPNSDSLEVVNNFLEQDMKHLINTLQWK